MVSFLVGYAAAWLCWVAAGLIVNRGRPFPGWVLAWIIACAVALRVICLARAPQTSTDVWRYLWDGRVANSGINPYDYPPNALELRHFRDRNWRAINYRHLPTIYPPAAQVLFLGLARLRSGDAEAFRWAFMLFDIGSVGVLVALLRRTRRQAERVVWYAWCPLAVTEATAGAHVDAYGVFLLLVALLLAARAAGRPGRASAVVLGLSVMAKGPALLVAPLFARFGGWRAAAWCAATCIALALPYAGAGRRAFGGLSAYIAAWETNASIFLVLDHLLARITSVHFGLTRVLTTAGVVLAVGLLTWRLRPGAEWLLGATFAAFGVSLLLGAPTLPWYVMWVVPALCWWEIPALIAFALTVSVQYYARWIWPSDAVRYALLWAGYVPVYSLLAAQAARWRCLATARAPAPPDTPQQASGPS